jgi:hypothetical protein
VHGQPRYQIWRKCNKRQMTSCAEHAHIIPISRMVDFCESYNSFHVCLTIHPFAHLVYATSHLSFVAFYSYLVSWLAMIWACAYYTDFTDGWNNIYNISSSWDLSWTRLCLKERKENNNNNNETARVVVLWYPHSLYISWCVVKYYFLN